MISSPSISSPRAHWTDWLEVRALASGGWAGEVLVSAAVGIASNEERDVSDDVDEVDLDPEIVDAPLNSLLDDIADEVGFRQAALGDDYPFELSAAPFGIRYIQPVAGDDDLVRDIYVFNLVMSALALTILKPGSLGAADHDTGRGLFHVCASLGVAGLIESAETYWFGFPRPDKTGFAAALKKLSARFGYALAKEPPPPGLPFAAKDDQVDVVGWRKYGDRRMGTLVILCQAATGNNWHAKSIKSHLEAFAEWFERSPYGLAWPSLAYPFVAHSELIHGPEEDFELALFNYLKRLSLTYGTLLDRLRIVQGARSVVTRGPGYAASSVAGWAQMPDLQAWKDNAIAGIRAI